MKATVYHGKGDVRLETVPDPVVREATDAIVRVTRAAICGSDLWFYRGVTQWEPGERTGHEFIGIVEETGSDVRSLRKGDRVVAPFVVSDGTCDFCRSGLETSCRHGQSWGDDANGGQAEAVRVPLADGTLVKIPDEFSNDERALASALATADVMGTGHHGVVTSGGKRGGTVVVVGDGAVGLCAVLSAAKQIGADRIVAVGHNEKRLELARRFGATETFNSHDDGVQERILELTDGGAPSVVEAVGNQESLDLAVGVARPGGSVTFVGVPHNVKNPPMRELFNKNVALRGAVAPTHHYIPELLSSIAAGRIDPSPVFDLSLPLRDVAEGYAAMDQRRAIKVILDATAQS